MPAASLAGLAQEGPGAEAQERGHQVEGADQARSAHTTEPRAALASGTVKKRIRMCGRPAVPSTRPSPSETVSSGW